MRSLWSLLLSKYHKGDQVEKIAMGGTCSTYGENTGTYRVLVGIPEGKSPLGRPRRRWKDYIEMDLQEVEYGCWTGLIRLRIGTGGGHL